MRKRSQVAVVVAVDFAVTVAVVVAVTVAVSKLRTVLKICAATIVVAVGVENYFEQLCSSN